MSFRELRSLCDVMCTLGYPRIISMENFRTPNFPLVADTLHWLIMRYEPSSKLSDNIDTEVQRISFINEATQIIASKARLILCPKSLYAADVRAVGELLKFARMLYDAVRMCVNPETDKGLHPSMSLVLSKLKPSDIEATRKLSSSLIDSSAMVHELLKAEESELRATREKLLEFLSTLNTSTEGKGQEALEKLIREAVSNSQDRTAELQRQLEELEDDREALVNKISKKSSELDRAQRRLRSVLNSRPVFAEEQERLEKELTVEHEEYVSKMRNLAWLQSEIEKMKEKELEVVRASQDALKKLQQKIEEEEETIARGDTDLDLSQLNVATQESGEKMASTRSSSSKPTPGSAVGRYSATGDLPSSAVRARGPVRHKVPVARSLGRMDAPDIDDDDSDAMSEGGNSYMDSDLGGEDDDESDFGL